MNTKNRSEHGVSGVLSPGVTPRMSFHPIHCHDLHEMRLFLHSLVKKVHVIPNLLQKHSLSTTLACCSHDPLNYRGLDDIVVSSRR